MADNLLTSFENLSLESGDSGVDIEVDRFEDGRHYSVLMTNMIRLEEAEDRKQCNERTIRQLKLTSWRVKETEVYACLGQVNFKLDIGEDVELSLKEGPHDSHIIWTGFGSIDKIENQFAVLLNKKSCRSYYPSDKLNNFRLDFVFIEEPFKRMKKACLSFKNICDSDAGDFPSDSDLIQQNSLKKMLLGMKVEVPLMDSFVPVSSTPGFSSLNDSQVEAIRHSLKHPLTLIQGPPGTGKTVTSANIAQQLRMATGSKVLISAPSNAAVVNLMEKVMKTNGNNSSYVRVVSKRRESNHREEKHLFDRSLHRLVEKKRPKLRHLSNGNLKPDEYHRLKNLKKKTEDEILREADFVFCTCSVAGGETMQRQKFQSCIIDECGQSVEPETMIPITLTFGRVVLVGDHKQLSPTVLSKEAMNCGMGVSLFERLIDIGISFVQLNVQYRMHPAISQFPSKEFYNGMIQDGVNEEDRIFPSKFDWKADSSSPLMFINISNGKESGDTSKQNIVEAKFVRKLVTKFRKTMKPEDIGVITPYDAQKRFLMQLKGMNNIEIDSVDGFQGREKQVIIFTCVRTKGIGFLKDRKRLNVALTRAKCGLIIVGNQKNLSRDPLWKSYLQFLEENNCIEHK